MRGYALATDIVRIELEGALAEGRTRDIIVDMTLRRPGRVDAYSKSTRTIPTAYSVQNAVILNDLYAIAPGETIEVDVYVKTTTGLVSDFDLTVKAASETNPQNKASDKLDLTTMLRIGANVTETVVRGGVYSFDLLLNEGATGRNIVWAVSDPSYALIDDDGNIYILNKTGTVRLIATDPLFMGLPA